MTKPEYDRKRYVENREKIIKKTLKWQVTNKKKYRAKNRRWATANPAMVRNNRLRYRYNISSQEYNIILATQNGLCAGCKQAAGHFKHSLHVDHDHSTHIVRGLLCWKCNSLLPARKNLKDLLTNLLIYLNDPPAVRALGEERKTKK